MRSRPRPLRWHVLGLAVWLGIGCAERPYAPAVQTAPASGAACTDSDIAGDQDPRRPC